MNKRTKEILSVILTLAIVSNGSVIKVLASEDTRNVSELNLDNKAIGITNKVSINKNKPNKMDMNQVVTVMVEIDDKADLEQTKNKISKVGQLTFKREFESLVRGFSIECKRSLIAELNNIEGVVAKESQVFDKAMASADAMTKAYNVWKNYGYKGQGVVVSIIDSGIDVYHKDMRVSDSSKVKIKDIKKSDETNFNIKVPYGKNFVEDNDEVIDKNPFTAEHGMHVAGIVAGNGEGDNGFKGVAPEAQLLAMKVFGNNSPSCREDDIIAAIEDSVAHGADIINMSLTTQTNFNDTNSMFQKAIRKATEKGVIVVVAAGNDGIMGTENTGEYPIKNELNLKDTSILGNPANTMEAITVASFENNFKTNPIIYLQALGIREKLRYDIPSLSKGFSKEQFGNLLEIDYLTSDELNNVSQVNKNLENKFVLIECNNDIEKLTIDIFNLIKAKKAQGIILSGDLDQKDTVKYGFMGALPVIMVDKDEANKIKNLCANDIKMYITNEVEKIDNTIAGSMSTFTSFGPTSDLEFKPDVTAPGGNIYSTLNDNRYGNMSGTSMASPHTAGAMALILQHIKNSGLEIPDNGRVSFAKNTLLNTAEIIEDVDVSGNVPYSPRRQGSGLIQIDKALKNNVIVTGNSGIGNIALKEIGYITDFEINLKNYGKQPTSFELDKTQVFTEKVINEKGTFGEAVIDGGALALDCNEITLMPGETKKVKAKLSLPVVLEKGIFVEGFIKFNSKDERNPSLNIPYMGYFGDYANEPIFYKVTGDKDNKLPSTSLVYNDSKGELGDNGFISPNGDGYKDGVSPMISLLRNCRDLVIDIVDRNDGKENVLRTIANKKDVRRLPLNSLLGAFLNSDSVWDGTVYDPIYEKYKAVPDGQYYMRLRAKVKETFSEYQTMYLPVRVDTKAPSLEVLETKVVDNKDIGRAVEVKFKGDDGTLNASGIDLSPISLKLMNDNKECPIESVPENLGENIYRAKFKLDSQEIKNLALSIKDNAGNETEYLTDICFENLNEGSYINSNALNEKGDIKLRAKVKQGVSLVVINDKKISPDSNNTIIVELDSKQGDKPLNIKLYDKDNKEIYSSLQRVIVDTIEPEIKELSFDKIKDIDNINSLYKVWGSVKETEENYEGVTLIINGQQVEVDKLGFFSKELELLNGGGIEAYLKDKAGNEYTYSTLFKEDSEVVFENIVTKDFMIYEPKGISSSGYLDVKGKAPAGTKKLYLNGEQVQLKEDGSFTKGIQFNEGLSKFIVRTIDKDNNKNDSVKMVIYDDKAPTLNINLDSRKDLNNNIIFEGDEINISGLLKDNTYGYKLTINGDEVINTISMININLPVGDNAFRERTFDYKIKLILKETTVNVVAEDINGNKIEKTYKIIKN